MSSINSLKAIIQQALSNFEGSSSTSQASQSSGSSAGISNPMLATSGMGGSSAANSDSSGLSQSDSQSGSGDFASELTSIITQALESAIEQVVSQMMGGQGGAGSSGSGSSGSGGSDSTGTGGIGSSMGSNGHYSGLGGSDLINGAGSSGSGEPVGTAPEIAGAYGPGSSLATNQAAASQQLNALGATPQEKAICMAVGMQETQNMSVGERDASKDGSSGANVSAFNLNADMLKKLGCPDPQALNDPSKQGEALGYMLKAIRTWGTEGFLNYQRGGSTGFQDGQSYDCAGYRSAILQSAGTWSSEGGKAGVRVAEDVAHQ